MAKVAGALLVGLIAIAAAIYFSPTSQSPSTPSYKGYEPVLSEWFGLNGYKVAKIKHLAGPYYAVRWPSKAHSGKSYCAMVDVSTVYKADSNTDDRFWYTGGYFLPDKKSKPPIEMYLCDF